MTESESTVARAVIGTPRDQIAAALAGATDALRKFNAVVAEMKVRVALNERKRV